MMMMLNDHEKDLVLLLAGLARRDHYECEDPWYSCPQSPDGCFNDDAGDDCNCGTDALNAAVEEILKALGLT